MQKEDIPPLAKVYVQVYRTFAIGESWEVTSAEKLLEYWLTKQPDLALVAEVDNKLVGAFVAGIKPWWDGNHLADGELFVDPAYQKKGIATALSKSMYKKAVEKYNVTSCDAYTFRKTTFPLNWYLQQGFKINEDWVIISGNVQEIIKKLKE